MSTKPNQTDKPNIIIIGASGHAKVIIDIIERRGEYNIIGLIDSFKAIGSKVFNYRIIGHEKDIPSLKNSYNFESAIIAIGDNWTRKIIFQKIIKIQPDLSYISAIHPDAIIGKNVKIGKGTVIMAGVIINSDAKIGEFCIINTKASLGHDSHLKNYSSLAPNSTIGGNVKIGSCTAICLSASVIQDISIGKHCIIGAGSLIIRDVQDNFKVFGIPGKIKEKITKGQKYLYHSESLKSRQKGSLEIITDKVKWQKVLAEIGRYDFYHTYEYHQLSKNPIENPILILYRTGNNKLIALPLLIRDIPNSDFKDATSTYGYAGPISNNIDPKFDNSDFIINLLSYLNNNNIISVFSRLNPFMPCQPHVLRGLGEISSQGKVVNINLKIDINKQRSLYGKRLKTHVNKARRMCSIRKAVNEEDLQTFINIYYENMDRVKAKKSYYFDKSYFENMMNSSSFDTDILLAIDSETNTIIGGSMFVTTNNIVQYHLSGTKNDFLHLTPTKLLIDEMRLLANKKGSQFYNLGGGLGGRDNDSLFNFKASFSNDFKSFYLWKLIVNDSAYKELVYKKGINENTNFFPLYRLMDDINVNL
ncbi:NeuD/PglB/VioB family sugar acetyltransferase [Seonamhaeicola sp. MEBiC1930]|uniref:NeuD/PglB/VioB family sugar acetyltransferase n=1 Tax=Seonamhaeicola sp. MEBiC01930 TaxID=2976768 RepID=UPI003254E42D